jgi:UDP-N-acetylglucosamine 2-epimerase (non-hydrolysing)
LIDNLQNTKTLYIGQHVDLIDNINCDYLINIDNTNNNRLNDIVCSILKHNHIFNDITHVLVQGDTTSVMAVAISAFHNGVKVIHLEAGLRTNNIYNPFPEECNRQLVSRIASIHLCPTEFNKTNLLNENIKGDIFVTGNTGLDNIDKSDTAYGNTVLITLHRRDNHHIMDRWFIELSKLAKKYKDIDFIFPVHPNPNVQKHKHLLVDVNVVKPINHDELIYILKNCKFVITDSGGIQEESSFLNKKVIVCRKTTERPESIGTHSILCNTPENLDSIVSDVYLNYKIDSPCPYGDGEAWKKIKHILTKY